MAVTTLTRRLGGFALAGVLLLAGLPQGQAQAQTSTDAFCPSVSSLDPPKDFPNRISGADRYATAACIMEYQLMRGYDDNTFRGDRPMTRAQTASIVVMFVEKSRNELVILPPDYTNSFTDIPLTNVHRNRIAQAHHLGIFNGATETEFRPNDPVTREQFATIMVQAMRSVGKVFSTVLPAHNFTNIEDSVHKDNIILATHHGLFDALQAAPLTPVPTPSVPTAIFDRLSGMDRYSIANVMAIGGTAAVSEGLWKSEILGEGAPPPAPIEEECDQLCRSERDL